MSSQVKISLSVFLLLHSQSCQSRQIADVTDRIMAVARCRRTCNGQPALCFLYICGSVPAKFGNIVGQNSTCSVSPLEVSNSTNSTNLHSRAYRIIGSVAAHLHAKSTSSPCSAPKVLGTSRNFDFRSTLAEDMIDYEHRWSYGSIEVAIRGKASAPMLAQTISVCSLKMIGIPTGE